MEFIAVNSYIKKKGRKKINILTFPLKTLRKEGQNKLKVSKRKEIMDIREGVNEKENRKAEIINKMKSQFFQKINQIDTTLVRLIEEREGA